VRQRTATGDLQFALKSIAEIQVHRGGASSLISAILSTFFKLNTLFFSERENNKSLRVSFYAKSCRKQNDRKKGPFWNWRKLRYIETCILIWPNISPKSLHIGPVLGEISALARPLTPCGSILCPSELALSKELDPHIRVSREAS
jgi:hypothetical protein